MLYGVLYKERTVRNVLCKERTVHCIRPRTIVELKCLTSETFSFHISVFAQFYPDFNCFDLVSVILFFFFLYKFSFFFKKKKGKE